MGFFGIKPTGRDIVPSGLRSTGFEAATDGSKSVLDKYLNQLIFETQTDHVWGTEAQTKAVEPEATFYTDASGNPLDASDSAVAFNDDDRIVMVHDAALTANLVIDGGGKRLEIKTDRGVDIDLDGSYKIQLDDCDRSIVNLSTSGTLTDSVIDNTSKTTILINNKELYNQPAENSYIETKNNSTNPTFQADITFKWTFYDSEGRSVVSEQSTPLVMDLTVNRAVNVSAEGSASEQADKWYYAHVFTRGDGVNDYLWSTNPKWEDVDSSDKPIYNVFVKTLTVYRNDGSSDFLDYIQIDDLCYLEKTTIDNIGSISTASYTSVDISSLVPETVKSIVVRSSNSNGGGVSFSSSFTGTKDFAPGTSYTNTSGKSGNEIPVDSQNVYVYANGGTTGTGIHGYRIHL